MSRPGTWTLRGGHCWLTLAVLGALSAHAASAANVTLETNPDSTLTLALQKIEGEPIALAEAQRLALIQATPVRAAEAAFRAARGSLRHERGAFDPELFADAVRSGVDQPTASPFSGASVLQTEETKASAGGRVKLPTGTELTASLETSKLESNSAFSSLVPQYDTEGALSVRQPILKGLGPGTWGDRSSAARELEAASARYEDAVLDTRAQVERTYWDLYAAERDLGVQQIIRDRAAALLEETRLREKAGLVGPNAVATARVFLSEQEQVLLDREEQLDRTSDRLGTLIGKRSGDGTPRFRPSDSPPRDFPIESQDSLVARALRQSRELRSVERRLEAARARARGAKWNALPTLDFIGSLGGKGLSGTGRHVVFGTDTLRTTVSGDFSDTWTQVRKRQFPTWSAGFSLTIPLGFRADGGEHDRLRGEADEAEQALIATRRSLEERVRAGHRELVHASKRMEAAQDGIHASLEQVRIGLLEYHSGRTTAFELVRLAADLATAQQRYSQALVRTAKAAADLRRLTSEGLPEGKTQ